MYCAFIDGHGGFFDGFGEGGVSVAAAAMSSLLAPNSIATAVSAMSSPTCGPIM